MTLTLQAVPPNIQVGTLSVAYVKGVTGDAPEGLLLLTLVTTVADRVCIPEGTLAGATVFAHGLLAGFRRVAFVPRFVQLDGSSHQNVLSRADVDMP